MLIRHCRWLVWSLCVLLLGLGGAVSAHAGTMVPTNTVTWQLKNVVFGDGGTVSGTFTIQYFTGTTFNCGTGSSSDLVSNWNINVNDSVVGSFLFNTGNSTACVEGDPLIRVLSRDPFGLDFTAPIPGTGGTQDITDGTYTNLDTNQSTTLTGGQLNATPEPATWALLGTGALLLLGAAWRRRRAEQ
ncbi:MAG: PEP-CTERM sorting domain-containing protein [Terriglobales bacterium]